MERCFFCGGNIIEGRCLQCARSSDFEYEIYVMEAQKKHVGDDAMWHIKPRKRARGFYNWEWEVENKKCQTAKGGKNDRLQKGDDH